MATKTCPYCAEEIQEAAVRCKHCGTWLSDSDHERLTRSTSDRMLAGICGGVGRYLRIDSTWIRVAAVVATPLTGLFPLPIIYFVLAVFVIPTDTDIGAS